MNRRSIFATLAALPLLSGLFAPALAAAAEPTVKPAALLMSRAERNRVAGPASTPTAVVKWDKAGAQQRFMLVDGVPVVVGDLDTTLRLDDAALALVKSWQDAPSSPYITDGTINRAGVALLQAHAH